jgi:hypothetical protein
MIGERRFQIYKGDVGGTQQGREIAEGRGGIGQAASACSDIAGQHNVATAENARGGMQLGIGGGRRVSCKESQGWKEKNGPPGQRMSPGAALSRNHITPLPS